MDLLPGTTEHLRDKEGLDIVGMACGTEIAGKEDIRDSAAWASRILGMGFGDRTTSSRVSARLRKSPTSLAS
jgi:hypothetical protein